MNKKVIFPVAANCTFEFAHLEAQDLFNFAIQRAGAPMETVIFLLKS